jgi:hypothetical protein
MKSFTSFLLVLLSMAAMSPAQAQNRPRGNGGDGGLGGMAPLAPQFSTTLTKLFGDHKAFSGVKDVAMGRGTGGDSFATPCKLAFLDGKFRMEIDLTQAKGSQIPAGMTGQLKAMGMGEMTIISQEAKGVSYLVYPGLQSYAEISTADGKPVEADKVKVTITELGKETMNGHPCVKNKVVVIDQIGKTNEAIVWNATDLKKFPVHIETTDANSTVKMDFKDVKFDKPDAKLFEPPAGFARYENLQTMMQEALMKRLGGPKPGQ